ncbi:MAG: ribosome silencing factor [Desulfobacteraceae bacterium]|nr:ribosome silencing factor [Desulfobacteraceae bacterium]
MKKVHQKHAGKSSLELARLAGRAALDKKAENLVILDVRGISSFTDFFVLMTGRSTRHVQGLAEAVEDALREKRLSPAATEGLRDGLWVLLDYNDVVVHIFYGETREFYNLEGLWHDAPRVPAEAVAGEGQASEGKP